MEKDITEIIESPFTEKAPSSGSIFPEMIAVIDIGSQAIRMVIAQSFPDGRLDVLERLTRAVWFGRDVFQHGWIGSESMRAGIEILRLFSSVLQKYNVIHIRAVATAAFREATNADIYLDRIRVATGIQVEIIDTSEEIRLTVNAVDKVLRDVLHTPGENVVLADVGGGSTLVTTFTGGVITCSQGLNLGSVRMREMLITPDDSPQRGADIIQHHIAGVMHGAEATIPLAQCHVFLATGGDARLAAARAGHLGDVPQLHVLNPEDLESFLERCKCREAQELSRDFNIPLEDAQTLVPSLLVYRELFKRTGAEKILVSAISMRDGLLEELAKSVFGTADEDSYADTISAARTLALKYHSDLVYTEKLAELAVQIFDHTRRDHALGNHSRLLLQLAAILHEVGRFVNNRSYHKHTYYLVRNSEIFGLSSDEVEIVAQAARYSRRSAPRQSHVAYITLPKNARVLTEKLAAILRIAKALTQNDIPNPESLRYERHGDILVIILPPDADLQLKRRVLEDQGKLFENVFGVSVRFE